MFCLCVRECVYARARAYWMLFPVGREKDVALAPDQCDVNSTGFCFNGKHAHELRVKFEQLGGAASDSNLSCESTPRKHGSDLPIRTRTPRDAAILPWRVKREQEREQVLQRIQRGGAGRHQGNASQTAGKNASTKHPSKEEDFATKQPAKEQDASELSHGEKMAAARWAEAQARWDKRYEELLAFREKNGYNFETMNCSDKMAYGCELYWWTQNQRQVYKNGMHPPPFRLLCVPWIPPPLSRALERFASDSDANA